MENSTLYTLGALGSLLRGKKRSIRPGFVYMLGKRMLTANLTQGRMIFMFIKVIVIALS